MSILTAEEARQLFTWPPEVARSDLAAHFSLSVEDRRWLRAHRGATERAGLAVQLCGLRYLGSTPDDLGAAPREAVAFVVDQASVSTASFDRYAREADGRTRRRHVADVVEHAGWTPCGRGEWTRIRPPRRTATPLSSTRACSRPPAIWRMP